MPTETRENFTEIEIFKLLARSHKRTPILRHNFQEKSTSYTPESTVFGFLSETYALNIRAIKKIANTEKLDRFFLNHILSTERGLQQRYLV